MIQTFYQFYKQKGDIDLSRETMRIYRADISLFSNAKSLGINDIDYLTQVLQLDILMTMYKEFLFGYQATTELFKNGLSQVKNVPAYMLSFGVISQILVIKDMLLDAELYDVLEAMMKKNVEIIQLLEQATGMELPSDVDGMKEYRDNVITSTARL